MEDSTEIIQKEPSKLKKPVGHESHFFGVSARSIITLIVVGTGCYMSINQLKIEEPMYTLIGMVVAYYFGQNAKITKPEPKEIKNEKPS